MGADLLVDTLFWDRKRKLDWDAGHKVIDSLDTDALREQCVSVQGLHTSLKNLQEAINSGVRDAFTMNVLHLNMFITGGMSWGDDPCETFRDLQNLSSFPEVLNAVGFNLDEDLIDYKAIVMKILNDKELLPILLGKDKRLDVLIEQRLKRE